MANNVIYRESCVEDAITWSTAFAHTAFCVGFYEAIYGPALIDMKHIFGTSYSSISWAVGSRGIGVPLGGLIGGVLVDKYPKWLDTMLAMSTVLAAVTIAAAPYSGSLDVLWMLCFFNGFGLCTTNIAGQRILIMMWEQKSASPTHAMHGGYGIGALLIPLLVNPFLAAVQPDNVINSTNSSSTTNDNYMGQKSSLLNLTVTETSLISQTTMRVKPIETTAFDVGLGGTRVHIAFLIVGALTLVSAIPFFVYQCITHARYHKMYEVVTNQNTKVASRPLKIILNPATYTDGDLCYGIGMFLLLLMYYINVNGGEQGFGLFVRPFAIDTLEFSKDDASYLNTVYWTGFTVARALAAVIARFLHIKYLISAEAIMLLTSVTVLDIIGAKTPAILWVFTVLQGLLIGPLYPSGISYANSVMDVSGVCLMVICLASGLGVFLYSWLAGLVYDIFGPITLLYALQACGCFVFITVFLLRLISYRRESRYANHNGIARKENPTSRELHELAKTDNKLIK